MVGMLGQWVANGFLDILGNLKLTTTKKLVALK
jgi:hypothetical protein